ncbi:SDR family NAD(P)-dependent oxidoreductase [Rhodococcus koreensis]|uniref:SDR family NAD(P)-dependent oxidoreductase n=1 Tax=Rhodococcus koreensis TaxID=99653 RepID=UPI00366DAA08
MGRLEGKVAFISGATRGPGRRHAVRLASAGADIVAVDASGRINTVDHPLATVDEFERTIAQVEERGRTIVASFVDVRDRQGLRAAVDDGVRRLGRLDLVVAVTGNLPVAGADSRARFVDAVDADLIGVMNTVAVCLPHLKPGSSIVVVITSAAPGTARGTPAPEPTGRTWARRAVMRYVDALARQLVPHGIRVHTVHETVGECGRDSDNTFSEVASTRAEHEVGIVRRAADNCDPIGGRPGEADLDVLP